MDIQMNTCNPLLQVSQWIKISSLFPCKTNQKANVTSTLRGKENIVLMTDLHSDNSNLNEISKTILMLYN